jgi:hypothetical protein
LGGDKMCKSKKVIQNLETKLSKYLKEQFFSYDNTNKQFIGYRDELIFSIFIDTAGYGSRFEVALSYGYPLVEDKLDVENINQSMLYRFVAENEQWIIKDIKRSHIEKALKGYLNEIEFIYENYFLPIISKAINSFNNEVYIKYKYNELFTEYLEKKGEEDPAWVYQMEFLLSGKTQDEWTQEDSDKCEQLVKEKQDAEFPYEKIRKQILKTIEKNRPIYEEIKQKLFGGNIKEIVYDKNVFPTILEELFKDGYIEKTLNSFGFEHKMNVNTQGRMIYGETYYFYNGDSELQVILKEELFLEFILSTNNETYRVNKYDGKYFWFGWFVGERSSMKANISIALDKLKEVLENSIDY